jgi:CDP-glucose 4,6-dehydratase
LEIVKLRKFWKNKKVLVIGHTGFTGSWLTIFLKYLGSDVFGYSLKKEKKHIIFNKLDLNKITNNYCFADINSSLSLLSFVKKNNPEIIINLAAQSIVRTSYLKPVETYETNVMGAINLLNICKNIKCIKAILMVTTDKVYLNKEKINSYKETDKLGGFDPYSSSKAASEIAILSMQKSFFNKKSSAYVATARAGNIIGGGDWSEDRLIPDLIKAFFNKNKLIIRSPNSTRPWQHVLEAIYGYLILSQKLFERKKYSRGAWNFGPNESNFLKVRKLIQKINLLSNFDIKTKIKKSSLHESKTLKLNNSKAKSFLKWRPVLTLDEMISLTCEWYANMKEKKKKLYNLTINQIEFFISRI